MLETNKSKDDETTKENESTNEAEMMSEREKEFQKKIDTQDQTIQRLDEEIAKLRSTIDGFELDVGKKTMNKRKLDEVDDDNEREELQTQVDTLTEKLGELETALQDTREKLAESEWQETNSNAIDSVFIYTKLEALIERRMNQIEEKFTNMETKMETKPITHVNEVKFSFSNALSKTIINSTVKNFIQETKIRIN